MKVVYVLPSLKKVIYLFIYLFIKAIDLVNHKVLLDKIG